MKILRFLLFPVAIIYDLITSIRNILFDNGIFKQHEFSLPVIAVGNLSVGGTGKSPQIEYLIRLLIRKFKTATLSRGYKRKTKGFQLLDTHHNVCSVGDEPMQFYKKFKEISVAVDSNRVHGINTLIHKVKPQVILLDDALQHRKVKASLYILLTKYSDLYVDDFVLPSGNLRESSRGAERADIIVVTKCPSNLTTKKQEDIKRKLTISENQRLFFSAISYGDKIYSERRNRNLKSLKESKIVLVTGIASPKSLLQFLDSKSINYIHLNFPDHHNFSESDLSKIRTTFSSLTSKEKIILTTEKDYMRLENRLDELYYLPIENKFLNREKEFNTTIMQHINSKLDKNSVTS